MALTVLEICAGAGGQAAGLEAAGFDLAAAIEIDQHACDTLRKNRPQWKLIQVSVAEVNGSMVDTLTEQQRSANMRAVRGKNTAPEMLIRSTLHRSGYRFRVHRRDLPGTPDIVFSAKKRVLFVHGCFWHGHRCPRGSLPSSHIEFWKRKIAKNRERDRRAVMLLRNRGWKVLTVWQCETKDKQKLTERLLRFLEGTRLKTRKQGVE